MTIATSDRVRWLQVWSLAAVQGAISLTWIAYAAYLPKFIEQVFGYAPSQAQGFATSLLILESAIAIFVEPLFGSLSDRWQRWYSSRMPLIITGTIIATVIFMALPAIVILGNSHEVVRFLLPCLAVLWAIAMSTFRSPVTCLLGSFAGATKLALAGSVLTLVGGLVGCLRPFASKFILNLGAPITFTIASISLLAGVAALRVAMTYIPKQLNPHSESLSMVNLARNFGRNLLMVVLVGAAIGLGSRLLMGELLPRTLESSLVGAVGLSKEILIGMAMLYLAGIAIATGKLTHFFANNGLMIVSLGILATGVWLLSLGQGAIALIPILLCLIASLSIVNNGMVAFALTTVPQGLSGLTVGTFFAGLSGANAIFGYLVPKSSVLSLDQVVWLSATAFLVAGVAIAIGDRLGQVSETP
ncbi:MAG: MFS transporter [Pseudanabaenaceae cyanobacterium bins.39]|nr:MFS transporter [Pseudanabaenaceae cyanobacterium bins.39]